MNNQDRQRLEDLRARQRLEELRARAGGQASEASQSGVVDDTSRQRAEARNTVMSQQIDNQPVTRAVRAGAQAFNLSDEFAGLSTRAGNIFRSEEDRIDPQAAVQAERERVARYREERPVGAFAEEMLGGAVVTAPLAAVGAGARAAAAARPLLTSALGGATAGAVAGAGGGTDTQSRLTGAGIGAGIGGALGPVGVMAGRAIGSVGQSVLNRVRGQRTPSTAAMRAFGQVDDAITQADPDGAFVGERMGARGQELLTSLSQRSDDAGDIVRQAARTRQTGRTERVMNEVRLRTGNARGVDAIADVVEAEEIAKPLFDATDAARVRVGARLRELVRGAASEGVDLNRVAARQARGEATFASMLSDDALPDGNVSGASVRALIADVEDAASRAFREGGGNNGQRLSSIAQNMRRNLRDEVPEFAQASAQWRSARLDDRAFEIGQSVFDDGKQRAQIERQLRDFAGGMDDMSASERGQFLSGVLDAIERRVGTVSEGGNAASRLTRRNIQERLSIVFRDQADDLAGVLSRQNELAELDRLYQPTQGSHTAARVGAQGAEDRLYSGPVRRIGGNFAEGVGEFASQPFTSTKNVGMGAIRGRMPSGEAGDIAGMLTQTDNQTEIQRFMQQIAAERARRNVVAQRGVIAGTAAGAQGGQRQ